MPLSKLSTSSALAPGFDLWFLPEPKESQWSRKIDWYLNFQITRSIKHQKPFVPAELIQRIEDCGLEGMEIEVSQEAPTFIVSEGLLPNKKSIILPNTSSFYPWAKRLLQIREKLGSPSTKVFIPSKYSSKNHLNEIEDIFHRNSVSYVLESPQ